MPARWRRRASGARCTRRISSAPRRNPERLQADPVVGQVRELRVELPYNLPFENYLQILDDVITRIAPALGWRPADRREQAAA